MSAATPQLPPEYCAAARLAERGWYEEARREYAALAQQADGELLTLVQNDLAAMATVHGARDEALRLFDEVLAHGGDQALVRANRELAERSSERQNGHSRKQGSGGAGALRGGESEAVRVALISFLFNWPSTGGGIVHTVELCRFLRDAGYEVQLICPQFDGWAIGRVGDDCPFPVEVVRFESHQWQAPVIRDGLRQQVDRFAPDWVLIADCWNMKPHVAQAVSGYPYLLRMQAHECLCPLNNLRLLPEGPAAFRQCPTHQLADAAACHRCVEAHANVSGALHLAERQLAGVGSPEYDELLRRSLAEAHAVLTLNPLIAETLRPYCGRVETVTWGIDGRRFPKSKIRPTPENNGKTRLLFAGLLGEPIKGFRVLAAAGALLWEQRQDFEIVATSEPPEGERPSFVRYAGWKSQDELPALYRNCDACIVPTIAADGLSRTSVEAMAAARPVIAARIGGLPFTVTDGVTGLLFEPGNAQVLAAQIARLLDDPKLARRMGRAGRQVYEQRFTWETVIDEQYRPLLGAAVRNAARGE